MSEPAILDDVAHRARWLGRVRAGVQRVILCRGSLSGDSVAPALKPGWGDEVKHLLTGLPASGPEALEAVETELRAYDTELRAELERTRNATGLAPGDDLRLGLGLSFEEECLLWAIAAPDVDASVSRLYRVLGEVHRGAPILDFALQVAFGIGFAALDAGARLVRPDRPLARLGVLVPEHDQPGARGLALGLAVRAARPVVERLLGGGYHYVPSYPFAAGEVPPELVLNKQFESELGTVLRRAAQGGSVRLWLVGAPGTGRRSIGAKLAHDLSRPHWVIDIPALLTTTNATERVRTIVREARLEGALLQFHQANPIVGASESANAGQMCEVLWDLLTDHRIEVLFDSDELPAPSSPLSSINIVRVPRPSPDERARIWRHNLSADVPGELATNLARRYFLTGGQIVAAARCAVSLAASRPHGLPTPTDLATQARAQLKDDVSSLASRVEQTMTWDDVVLPDEVISQYREILSYARNQGKIFDDWGFYRKLGYGRGLSVLLTGSPGTGKTMLAEILAGELGVDLYKIDLSQVQSKFIGETEKHLSRLFDYAAETGAALLFDEADSLFAKRTQVKSSVDRYANLNVNYLLQRIEAFAGVTVLTTNLKSSLDPALLRRIRFTVEVPAPDIAGRGRLWKSMIPPETPTTLKAPDFKWLAANFELSGGHIKNAVVRAAISAAEHDQALGLDHLRDAATWTCRELGMLVRD